MSKCTRQRKNEKMLVFILPPLSIYIYILKNWDYYFASCFETYSFNLRNIFWMNFQHGGICQSHGTHAGYLRELIHMQTKWGSCPKFRIEGWPREMSLSRWGRSPSLERPAKGNTEEAARTDRAFPNSRREVHSGLVTKNQAKVRTLTWALIKDQN